MTAIRLFRRECLCILFSLVIATLPTAGQSAASGIISGTVTDSSGAAIPNATVVITDTDTGAVHNLVTNGEGSFSVPFLQSGHYEVLAGAPSFTKADHKNLTLTVGETLTVNSTLAVSVNSDVQVTTEGSLIDTQKVESSQTVTQEFIDNLPVNGRRWDNFVLLTANVAPDANSGLVSFRGINGLYNSNMVDGVSNQEAFFAEARGRAIIAPYVYSPDSIKEFQSSVSGYSAEFGNAAGGVVNAITKSGSNAVHGDLFYYLRYPSLNALDPFNKWNAQHGGQPAAVAAALLQPVIHQQQQFGGSVGGPIIKNKLFYFLTYDGFRRAGPALYSSSGLTTAAITGFESTGCPTGVTITQCTNAVNYLVSQQGSYTRNIVQNIFFPKLDWQPTEKDHVSLSYLWGDYKQPNAYVATPALNNSGISTNATYYVHSRFLVGGWDRVINANTASSLKAQWSRDLEATNTNGPGPNVTITGLAVYGEATGVPRIAEPDEHRLQIFEVLSQMRGHHTLKVGADINFLHDIMIQLFEGDGLYSYPNFAAWVQDATGANGGQHYTAFAQAVDPITHDGKDDFWNQNVAFFGEDTWSVLPSLTIAAGIRYDLQLVPQPTVPFSTSPNGSPSPLGIAYTTTIPIDHHMIAPRIGFAFNPYPGTVVRGGYGLFFADAPLSSYYNIRVENGKYQGVYNLNPSGTTYPTGAPKNIGVLFTPPGPPLVAPFAGAVTPAPIGIPACATGSTACLPISFHGMDPHFTPPYTHSFDLAVEQQLTPSTSLTLAYTGTRGMRLPYAPDRNITSYDGSTRSYDVVNTSGVTLKTVTVPFYPSSRNTGIPLPSPNDGNISVITSSLNTWYNALSASIKQQMKWGFQGLLNYTWAHTEDGGQVSGATGTFFGTDIILDPFNRRNQYSNPNINMSREASNSDIDMRERFVASLVYTSHYQIDSLLTRNLVNGWTVAGTATEQTGFPVTAFMGNGAPAGVYTTGSGAKAVAGPQDGGATGGGDNTGNTPSTAYGRDPFDKRNGFPGPGVHNLDMRISRDFALEHNMRFEILAEAFNVVNHRNGLAVANVAYDFAAPASTGAAATYCPAGSHTNTCIVPYTSVVSTTTPFGTINSTSSTLYGARQLQFVAKLFF